MIQKPQNTSHAVMAQRAESKFSLDNFPTPPWATRALLEQILDTRTLSNLRCIEPACGAGHMTKVLKEYFSNVRSSDIYPYGYGEVQDFLNIDSGDIQADWMITNPPFRHAEEFILKGLSLVERGVAVLTRTVFLESVGRYERLFKYKPPTTVAQFTERVPMIKGRLDQKASTATGYCWLVWDKNKQQAETNLTWIKPCRKVLEQPDDYIEHYSSMIQGTLR